MPIIGIVASSVAPTAFESIQTVTVGSGGQGTIVFSSIPSTYSHLQIRALNVTSATYADMQFNGDTGSNYTYHQVESSGSTVATSGSGGLTSIYTNQLGGNATFPSIGIIDLYDYASTTKYKTARLLSGVTGTSGGQIYFRTGLWLNTNAINQITIRAVSGGSTFAQHTTYALYGIKGA